MISDFLSWNKERLLDQVKNDHRPSGEREEVSQKVPALLQSARLSVLFQTPFLKLRC